MPNLREGFMRVIYWIPRFLIATAVMVTLVPVAKALTVQPSTPPTPTDSKPETSQAADQAYKENAAAYGAWSPVEGLLRLEGRPTPDRGMVAWLCWSETHARELRALGMVFHDEYPNDPRWLIWLRATVNEPPHYWKDCVHGANAMLHPTKAKGAVLIDGEAAAAWDQRYPPLRAQFLASPAATHDDRVSLLANELDHKMWQAQLALNEGRKTNFKLREAQQAILELGAECSDANFDGEFNWARPRRLADQLLSFPFHEIWRLQADAAMTRSAFLAEMAQSASSALRASAAAHAKVTDYADPRAAQSIEEQSRADAAWEAVEGELRIDERPLVSQRPEAYADAFVAWNEVSGRHLRELGLKFHDTYPKDPRWIEWLVTSSNRQPRYWKEPLRGAHALMDKTYLLLGGVVVDEPAKAAWEKRYPALRAEFLASPWATYRDRVNLRSEDLAENFWNAYRSVKGGRTTDFDVGAMQTEIFAIAAESLSSDAKDIQDGRGWPAVLADDLFSYPEVWRLQADKAMTKEAFLAEAKQSPSDDLRAFAIGQERIAEYGKKPLDLHFTGLDGREIDMEQLRGKVVMIDIWATTCAVCIDNMPRAKELYDEYRTKGFEAISIALDREEDRQKVLNILKKHEIQWPQFLDTKQDSIARFGVVSVPVVLVIDRNGFIVADIRGGGTEQFEPLIRKYLDL